MDTMFWVFLGIVICGIFVLFILLNRKMNDMWDSLCETDEYIDSRLKTQELETGESKSAYEDVVGLCNASTDEISELNHSVSELSKYCDELNDKLDKVCKYVPEAAEKQETDEKDEELFRQGVLNIINYSSAEAARRDREHEGR